MPKPPAHEDSQAVHLSLLGGFELVRDGQSVRLPLFAQRLLAFLAIENRPVQRVRIAGVLWPDTTEEQAYGNLRSMLCKLRLRFAPIVHATRSDIRLAPTVVVDIAEQSSLAMKLLADPAAAEDADVQAILAQDLLPDWYDDWVLVERERMRQLRLHALEIVADRRMRSGRYAQAVQAALAALKGDPLRETAHRLLIRTHLAEGNRGEAIRHHGVYRTLLRDQLGLEPSFQWEELQAGLAQAA